MKDSKQLTQDQYQKLLTHIDELQVTLALGKADTKQKITEQRQKINADLKALEQNMDHFLKERSTEFTQQMIKASDKLEAEFAALELRCSLQSQKAKENLQNKKHELTKKIDIFKHNLAEKRKSNEHKSVQFEKELTQGLQTIKSAFQHLND